MKPRKSKHFSALSVLIIITSLLSAFTINASAANFPFMLPKELHVNVNQGELAKLEFNIFHEFQNEHAYVKIHQGSRTGPVVSTADQEFRGLTALTSLSSWGVAWDTSGVEPGDYIVEYYVDFYSLYRWNEAPNHDFTLTVHVKAPPCPNGHSYNSGEITQPASCDKTGVKTYTCTACGNKKTEEIPAFSHKWDSGVITAAPTVTTGGVKTYTCLNCGATSSGATPSIFKDVSSGAYYASAVEWAYKNGVTAGMTETTFSPNSSCTRGQVVTFLWRASGSPDPQTTQNPFTDIDPSKYFYKAILWAVEMGITTGTTETTFSPQNTCSNAHILTFLWRAQGKPGSTGVGLWYEDAVKWASNSNLLTDTSAAKNIGSSCPRADVVTFLYRVLSEDANVAKPEPTPESESTTEPEPSPESAPEIELINYWPRNNATNYVPKFDYATAYFSQKLDPKRCPAAYMQNLTTGATYTLKTERGSTEHTCLLVLFNGRLKDACEYIVTIPANCIYSTDGSVYGEEITFRFSTPGF